MNYAEGIGMGSDGKFYSLPESGGDGLLWIEALCCAAGSYLPMGAAECALCPAGSYRDVSLASCVQCNAGYYSLSGAAACTACDSGN